MIDIEVIAPHFKRRLSGVTSTVVQLIPQQRKPGLGGVCKIVTLGPGLPDTVPKMKFRQIFGLWRRLPNGRPRIWHARRNNEMLVGVVLRDLLRMKLKLVFTSAAQRHHTSFTRFLIRRMDRVIATSARSGSFLEVPHSVVMHGIDTDLFHPATQAADEFTATGLGGRFAIGCCGRLRPQKGTDLFIEAMIHLLPHYPDWTAIVTGRTTHEHQAYVDGLKARIEKAGLGARIHFLGEVEDIKPWYRRFSLLVAPSREEGFGLTPLEAMASATAVVASTAGAYAEMVVPGITGAVVKAGDGEALTAAIEPYLVDPQMAARHGQQALIHMRQNFAIAREVAGIRAVYQSLYDRY